MQIYAHMKGFVVRDTHACGAASHPDLACQDRILRRIRATFGIHNEDYLRSVGPEQLLGNMAGELSRTFGNPQDDK